MSTWPPTVYRKQVRAAGYSPVPVEGKAPAPRGWQKFTDATDDQIELWQRKYPRAENTGILTKFTPPLDIDIWDPEAAEAVEKLVRDRYEECGAFLVRFGYSPKRAILFQTDTPFKKISYTLIPPNAENLPPEQREQKVEVLGDGQQIVVDGIHPDTGKPYSWHGGKPGDVQRKDLPSITEQWAKELAADIVDLLIKEYGYKLKEEPKKQANGEDTEPADWNVDWSSHDSVRDFAMCLRVAGTSLGAIYNLCHTQITAHVTDPEKKKKRLRELRGIVDSIDAKKRPNREAAENPIKLLSYTEMVLAPPIDWGIHGVWPRRAKSVLYGQSDSFKSFLACDLACSAATGRSWHGYEVKQFKVIYIANEGANAVGRKRIPAWMAYHDIPHEDRQNIFLIKVDVTLPDETSRANLLAAIRTIVTPGEDFGIVIDVLRGTMTGSESDDEAAFAWTKAAEILIEEGAAILTITHSPYSEEGRMRGHSHLWGSFDTRLHVEGNKEQRTAILKVNRHKEHDSGGQWGFKLEEQEVEEHPGETSLVPRLDGEVKQSKKHKKLPASVELALAALKDAQFDIGKTPPACEHIPWGIKAVTMSQWQDYVERSTGSDMGDKNSKERRAFYRARDTLKVEHRIGIWDPYVWAV